MHKKIRLESELSYQTPGAIFHHIICVKPRVPIFATHPDLTRMCVDVLKERAAYKHVPVYVFCFMPDHVHLTLGVPEEGGHAREFVDGFKRRAVHLSWQLGLKGTFWQKRHYDRAMRNEDDFGAKIGYILHNPVRKGLVKKWDDYPFSGSLVLNFWRPPPDDKTCLEMDRVVESAFE